MNSKTYVVIHDPEGKFWEGAVISDRDRAILVDRASPAVTLPIDTDLLRTAGCGGYVKRAWGSGWPLQSSHPTVVCPMTVWVPETHSALVWVARVVPLNENALTRAESGEDFLGSVRLIADTGSSAGTAATITTPQGGEAKPLHQLGPADAEGGWTVTGVSRANVRGDTVQAMAFFAVGEGLALAWAAVSTMKE